MSKLESFIVDLQQYLTKNSCEDCNIIRKHSKKLEQLGDVSFPLKISNWYQLLDKNHIREEATTILGYGKNIVNLEYECTELKETSANWSLKIDKVVIISPNAHIFLEKSRDVFTNVLHEVLDGVEYGEIKCLNKKYTIKTDILNNDLTSLRLQILTDTAQKFIEKFSNHNKQQTEFVIDITLNQKSSIKNNTLCGPVLNEKGLKTSVTAEELYRKRASDMRMMAQHKYGVQIKKIDSWENYFIKLGEACVKIEMLSNKSQKPIKITLNDLQTANKGASFIFYNCARIAALLKEFHNKVQQNVYPELPKLLDVDFSTLTQPEEWELFYVYILQYPILTKSCIKDIEKGNLNVHYLVAFLSNLCSIFSAYYRRIRILRDPREHLFSVLYARIYLLMGLQYVFHHALSLMNIEPVKEM